ncbi:hypothetical protein WMY93_032132 [Mugilogobius chulae]|uniref:Uncharacterized protein n=1 Tax=Mugilogobius chulae TaxID=88201 RepID=A0AAW0MEM7_9GOBI
MWGAGEGGRGCSGGAQSEHRGSGPGGHRVLSPVGDTEALVLGGHRLWSWGDTGSGPGGTQALVLGGHRVLSPVGHYRIKHGVCGQNSHEESNTSAVREYERFKLRLDQIVRELQEICDENMEREEEVPSVPRFTRLFRWILDLRRPSAFALDEVHRLSASDVERVNQLLLEFSGKIKSLRRFAKFAKKYLEMQHRDTDEMFQLQTQITQLIDTIDITHVNTAERLLQVISQCDSVWRHGES